MRRDGQSARHGVRLWVVALVCLMANAVGATEPVGSAILEASWVHDSSDDPDRRTVRLAVRPLVSLPRWDLVVTVPLSYEVRAQAVPEGVAFRGLPTTGFRTLRATIPELQAGSALILELEVLFPPHDGGTISFVAEAEDGRVLGGTGITTRAPASPPRRRLGAVEYPASVVPPPGPR